MWKAIKAWPVWLKVAVGVLILGGIYRLGTLPNHDRNFGGSGAESEERQAGVTADGSIGSQPERSPEDGGQQRLAQFQAQQSQLMAQVYQCEQEMTRATQQMAQAAMNGMMANNRPQCEQFMPQWTAQEAYLETEIYRIKTGDTHSTVREITGIAADAGGGSRTEGSGGARSGDGTGAVEDWDRGAIRGTSLYVDESGESHELATRPYYFRDRSSGQMIGSDQPTPPNNGRDYEELQLSNQPH